MYRFSRAIYREIASEITEDPHGVCPHANHERVLRACEATVERMATDRHYFARPARTLFSDIRVYFPMSAQERRVVHERLKGRGGIETYSEGDEPHRCVVVAPLVSE